MSEFDARDHDNVGATAPLMESEHGVPQESTGISDKVFIWSLTLSAGVSGLLFGYEYVNWIRFLTIV